MKTNMLAFYFCAGLSKTGCDFEKAVVVKKTK